ncbi:MAG: FtsX-like permease family protein [Spirochaetaceae bacterium]|nr:FtsX-like permease family protein [Spirochaetaceae bacterium]
MISCLFIAFRYVGGKNSDGGRYLLGGVAGIALSLVPVVVTLIVADGMIRGIMDRFIELGTGHIQVLPYSGSFNEESEENAVIEAVRSNANVCGVWKQRESLGIVIGDGGKTGISIRAVDPLFWQDGGSRRYITTIAGEAALNSDGDALIGEELAKITGVKSGGIIRIMTARRGPDGKIIPRATVFKVNGIISSGYRELDSMWCVISYNAGKRVLSPEAGRDSLVVKIDDAYKNIDRAALEIQWAVPGDYGVYRWKDILRSQYSSYESTRQLLLFIMLLIVFVAAVNISSVTSMLAIERRGDIAVLKAFGIKSSSINSIFLWCSFLIGAAGSFCGIMLGVLTGCSINHILRAVESVFLFFSERIANSAFSPLDQSYYLQTIPVIVDWKTITVIGFFTILCSCASSFFPARKAGKTPVVELLNKH